MYNPFISAAKAAIAALTTDEAKAYYSVRAQQDTQAVADAALSIGIGLYQVCLAFYTLGAIAGEAHYNAVTRTVTVEPETKLIEGTKAIAIAPASIALPVAPIATDAAIITAHGVTFAPEIIEAEVIEPKYLPTPAIAALPEGKSEKQVRKEMMKFTRQDLRDGCTKRNIKFRMNDSKTVLANKLIKYQKAQGGRLVGLR